MKASMKAYPVVVFLAASCFGAGLGCDNKPLAPEPGGRVALPEAAGKEAPPLIGGGAGGGAGRNDSAGRERGDERQPSEAQGRQGAATTATAASFGAELANLYTAWAGEEKVLVQDFAATLDLAIAKEGIFQAPLTALYKARNGQPIMSRDGVLSDDADALVQAIEGVETHGLDPKPYEPERLAALLQAFSKGRLEADAKVGPGEDKALWQFVLEQRPGGVIDGAALGNAARARGFRDEDLPRLSAARMRLNELLAGRKVINATLAELDVHLTGTLYRWVFDMRLAKRAHPFLADRSDGEAMKRVSPELDKMLTANAATLSDRGVIAGLVASVVPKFPDYEPTREALARYRDYASKYPDHIDLPKEVEKLGPGKSGDNVTALETRLAQEQYFQGSASGKWSTELEEAISEYQETHQMKGIGKVDKLTRTSLNKPYAERAAAIALSLQRYRESDLHQGAFRFGEVPVRGRVNIPSMEARFYVGTEIGRRHRVIVGNNDNETDGETGKKGKLNQTRLFTAEMATVVLNPVWNVPKRIKEQELDQMLMDEPDYYEKHNFKVELNPDGTERVVQQPGPGNALGLVKFLFPNQFSIYMHDTPKKKLFERSVRAFSHGCMRTENPLDLARWLLVEIDKEMSNEEFDEVLAKREERHFALNPKLPISTDYVTTTIDEEGRIVFLADVYGFDRDYMDGKTPYRADKDQPLTIIF